MGTFLKSFDSGKFPDRGMSGKSAKSLARPRIRPHIRDESGS